MEAGGFAVLGNSAPTQSPRPVIFVSLASLPGGHSIKINLSETQCWFGLLLDVETWASP